MYPGPGTAMTGDLTAKHGCIAGRRHSIPTYMSGNPQTSNRDKEPTRSAVFVPPGGTSTIFILYNHNNYVMHSANGYMRVYKPP